MYRITASWCGTPCYATYWAISVNLLSLGSVTGLTYSCACGDHNVYDSYDSGEVTDASDGYGYTIGGSNTVTSTSDSQICVNSMTITIHYRSIAPTRTPTIPPTLEPTRLPTVSTVPTLLPTTAPTPLPTSAPTMLPTPVPTFLPTPACGKGQGLSYTWVSGTRTAPVCDDCQAGKYSNETGDCQYCDSGSYVAETGAYECLACDEGEMSSADRTSCGSCPAGTFVFNETSCEFCSQGKYAPSAQTDDW